MFSIDWLIKAITKFDNRPQSTDVIRSINIRVFPWTFVQMGIFCCCCSWSNIPGASWPWMNYTNWDKYAQSIIKYHQKAPHAIEPATLYRSYRRILKRIHWLMLCSCIQKKSIFMNNIQCALCTSTIFHPIENISTKIIKTSKISSLDDTWY